MALSVVEQIALKVKERLQTVSSANGYETTVAGTVVRPTKVWEGSPLDYQVVMAQGQMVRNEDLSYPANPPVVAYDLPFTVVGELRPSQDNTAPIESLCNEFAADVHKAICTPVASWHNWDGLAINTTIESWENTNSEEAAAFKLEFTVTFRTAENDPFTARA
jgi:hypothetical protein